MPEASVSAAGAPYATAIRPPIRTRTGVSSAWVAASYAMPDGVWSVGTMRYSPGVVGNVTARDSPFAPSLALTGSTTEPWRSGTTRSTAGASVGITTVGEAAGAGLGVTGSSGSVNRPWATVGVWSGVAVAAGLGVGVGLGLAVGAGVALADGSGDVEGPGEADAAGDGLGDGEAEGASGTASSRIGSHRIDTSAPAGIAAALPVTGIETWLLVAAIGSVPSVSVPNFSADCASDGMGGGPATTLPRVVPTAPDRT